MIAPVLRKARTLLEALADFQRDPVASLSNLNAGLKERKSLPPPEVVARVTAAYQAAKRDQELAGKEYQPNGEWAPLIQAKLQALSSHEFSELLGDFFRNESFGGLSDYATSRNLTGTWARINFVNHMVHDYRVWLELTGEAIRALQTPTIGNPFGYVIDEVLTTPGCFRRHYMASKATALVDNAGTIAEIGGGYGELAYFALRGTRLRYIDFDLPEVLLLASYYLCSSLPERNIALYGEGDPHEVLGNAQRYDAILFPNFCLPHLPENSVDAFVNTRSLSEMASDTVNHYLHHISRTCTSYFLHENSDQPLFRPEHTEVVASSFMIDGFRLLSKTISPWRAGGGRYREFLYERRGHIA